MKLDLGKPVSLRRDYIGVSLWRSMWANLGASLWRSLWGDLQAGMRSAIQDSTGERRINTVGSDNENRKPW